jgi:serine/threonine-protein kinase
VRELGFGSQGRVWEALHLQMGTPLALKVLDPNLASRPDYVSRFKREASAAAALRSSHVVQIFDFGISHAVPYIAMELLEGEDLGLRLERVCRLPANIVASIVTQVSRALARAHKRGIVHRDLKPDNIFLCASEEGEGDLVKILDFGVAKAVSHVSLAHTGTGVVLGTPYYMSPEQAQGDRRVDHRTDLWAIGVITFEAMVGRRPFEATNLADLLVKICALDPPTPSSVLPSVPEGFDEWFMRACARNPDDRFPSAKEMATSLALLCGSIPAVLSESTMMSLFQQSAPLDESEVSARVASHGNRLPGSPELVGHPPEEAEPPTVREPPPAIADSDATQVMTDLPAELAEARDGANAISVEREPQPARRLDSRLATAPPRVVISAREGSSPHPSVDDDADDERVEIFSSAVIAENIARAKAEREHDARRERHIALLRDVMWPAIGVAVAITVLLLILAIRNM